MTIGEELKRIRKKLHLNQTQMAAGVISTAFYSKVERGDFDIDTMKLISILHKHGISATNFIKKIENNSQIGVDESLEDKIHHQLIIAYSNQDIRQIKYLRQLIQKNNLKNLDSMSLILLAVLEKDFNLITNKVKENGKKQLFKTEDWNRKTLELFSDLMTVFNIDETAIMVNSILRKYGDNSKLNKSMTNLLSSICINFLAIAYLNKYQGKTIEKIYKFLREIPEIPENFFAKVMVNYYQALFKEDKKTQENILKFMEANNLSHLAKNMTL